MSLVGVVAAAAILFMYFLEVQVKATRWTQEVTRCSATNINYQTLIITVALHSLKGSRRVNLKFVFDRFSV